MPLSHARNGVGIETASVVADGEEDAPLVESARNADVPGLAVADGVGRELADDAQDRMRRREPGGR